ncbi:hypothetical protein C8R44DRAFT_873354 [Mycena epipterygia]|nr:hypothetical protein C8R44DRAFT_873354 [Mycena epipterygia]
MSSNPVLAARLVPNTLLACATVLVYDWLCTLDQEISHVWARPWSTGTLFFVFNRYLPFIDVLISLSGAPTPFTYYLRLSRLTAKLTRISPEQCLTRFKFVGWLTIFGIFLSEVILMLRTYALWERKRGVLISLTILSVCTVIPTAVFVQLELASLEYVPTDGVGCSLAKASSIIIFAYLMLMISETTIVVLTTIKACQALRHSRQPWLVQLYRDGILFYVYLLAISLANILVPILAPAMFSNWLASAFCIRSCAPGFCFSSAGRLCGEMVSEILSA